MSVRYERDDIYTCIGERIVISINPFKKLNIYDFDDFLMNKNEIKAHLFKIADNSLMNL